MEVRTRVRAQQCALQGLFIVDRDDHRATYPIVLRRYSQTRRSVFVALALLPALACELDAQAPDLNKALSDGAAAYEAKDYARAITNFTTILQASAEGAPEGVYYQLGFSYFSLLQYQEAANTFVTYLKKHPGSGNAPEVHLYLGRSLLQLEGKADEALGHLAEAAKKAEYAEEARFLAADAFIKKGDKEKAAKTLEIAMNGNSSGPSVLRASLQLIDLYIADADFDKAVAILDRLEKSPGYADVIVTVNHRFVQIGDKRLEAKEYSSALSAYSNVRARAQVLAIQTKRLAAMKTLKEDYDKRIANAEKIKQQLPRGTEDKAATLAAMIEGTEKVLTEVRGLTEYDATLQYRIGRCYFNMDRFWPASIAFEAVANSTPPSSDASTALYGAIICQWKLERRAAASELCVTYLKRFPKEKHVNEVANLNATLLLQDGKTDEVIAFLDPFIKENPDMPSRKELMILLANSRFQGGKFDDAAKDYEALKKEFGDSPENEEFIYRSALCDFLRNDYEATIKGFDSYEKNFPNGQFRADIRYRRGIIQLATKEYDKLIASMTQLLKDPNAQGFGGQIHTLLADAYSNRGNAGDNDLAATEYATALRTANGDDNVISYSLEQATNLLRSARRWDDLQALWQDFLVQNPNHPLELRGVSELSKLLARADKKDEARAMLAKYALRDINNVRSEYVEMLLSQLAGQFTPPRTFKKDTPKPDIEALLADLAKQIEIPESERSFTYIARVNFAKAELARMMNDRAQSARFLNTIASTAKPDDLSPILLSVVGQFLLDDKQFDKAVPFFTRLRDAFPASSYSDAAPVGLGRVHLANKDYTAALEQFDFALNRAAGSSMLKEAIYGKGMALFGMRKWDEAKKIFEEIVGNKEWSGMEKAGSVFQLGEIAAQAGDKGAANAYFQKVYLSHSKFIDIAAKAYLRSAEMLEESGKHTEALKTYREMIANPKYADTPELKIARQKASE